MVNGVIAIKIVSIPLEINCKASVIVRRGAAAPKIPTTAISIFSLDFAGMLSLKRKKVTKKMAEAISRRSPTSGRGGISVIAKRVMTTDVPKAVPVRKMRRNLFILETL